LYTLLKVMGEKQIRNKANSTLRALKSFEKKASKTVSATNVSKKRLIAEVEASVDIEYPGSM